MTAIYYFYRFKTLLIFTTVSSIKQHFWIIFLAVFNFALHITFYNTLGFFRDELLYFSLGQHLSAGYASVPPFTGFLAWLIIHTFGYGLFGVRLLPALLSAIYLILASAITRELKGGFFAQVLAVIAVIVMPLNLRGFSMFQPVPWDFFFWTLLFYFVLRWINTGKERYIIFIGIIAGIGMMNKYLIALEIFCIGFVFLFYSYRVIYTKKSFYYALLLALIILLPNILWQIKNNLPVLVHMHALHDSQLVHVNRFDILTDQFFIGSMSTILIIPGIIFILISRKMAPYRPLVIASLLVVVALIILRGKSYYTAGLFSFWIAGGAVYWEKTLRLVKSRLILILIMVLITLPLVPMGIPVFKPDKLASYFAWMKNNLGLGMTLRWEEGRYHSLPQDYADQLGWDELTEKTATAYDSIEDKRSVMIYGENYGQAGAIMVIGKRYGLPEPTCFSESFFYWVPRRLDREVNTLIYINDELGDDVRRLFSDIHVAGGIENPLAREYGTTIWVCQKPVSSFKDFWEQRVPQVKSPF